MSDNINNGFPVPEEPITREEQYLSAIAQVTPAEEIPSEPLTRVEAYLDQIVKNGGGGGGGFTPTQAQLDAMNSGITAERLETDETNILSKANTSDVNTATANLQAQINNIVTPVTQDAEVENARIDMSGTSYTTLKERLDKHDYLQRNTQDELRHQFEIVDDKYARATDGKIRDSSNLFVTGYIPLTYPVVVRSKLDNDAAGICFYSAGKNFISGYNSYSDNEQEVTLSPPTNAAYVRVSCLKAYKTSFICRYDDVITAMTGSISNINSTIGDIQATLDLAQPHFWAQSMWKVLCIGDSLTSGANYTAAWSQQAEAGSPIDENYPRILGRLINGEVTNAGVGGYAPSDWWNNKKDSYTYNNYDTFIIWLGTNDGLTDTLATDVDPYDDYNDFAETETGYYCRIIEKIKENNPSCLIVLTTVFASDGSVSTTNNAIRHIAEKYNLPVIDNSDLTVANHPELRGGANNPHFAKAGNIYIAARYVADISNWLAENPLRCEYHYTARTN